MANAADKIEASKRIVEETKRLYVNILARPLNDKQLARPPFKFIQDLVKSLIVEARILRDVFNPADFGDARNTRVWDRRAKVEFVQKLIDYVANNKQPVVGCVASKVVAGSEPNKTNELLQSLARLAQLKLSGRRESEERARPRTFTRPSVSSSPPPTPSQLLSGGRSSLGGQQRAAAGAQASGSRLSAGAGTGASTASTQQRRPQQQQQQRRQSSKPAASAVAGGPVDTSRLDQNVSPMSEVAPTTAAEGDETLDAGSLASVEATREQQRAAAAASEQLSLRKVRAGKELPVVGSVSSSKSGNMITKQAATAASESDISRGIHRLRAGLGGLRALMLELNGTEDLLRESLQQALSRIAEANANSSQTNTSTSTTTITKASATSASTARPPTATRANRRCEENWRTD